jgi:hypothetical protein
MQNNSEFLQLAKELVWIPSTEDRRSGTRRERQVRTWQRLVSQERLRLCGTVEADNKSGFPQQPLKEIPRDHFAASRDPRKTAAPFSCMCIGVPHLGMVSCEVPP